MPTNRKDELYSLPFFGSPPLIPGEDEAAYRHLLTMVADTMKPADVLEMIWVRDFVDLEWEIRRWRRLKADLLRPAAAPAGLEFGLMPAESDAVMAIAVTERISPLERLDRMISLMEVRRNRALAQVQDYQEAKSLARRIADDVVDAEFHEVRDKEHEKPGN